MNHFFSFASIWGAALAFSTVLAQMQSAFGEGKGKGGSFLVVQHHFDDPGRLHVSLFVPVSETVDNNQIAIKLKRVDDTEEIGTVVQNPITEVIDLFGIPNRADFFRFYCAIDIEGYRASAVEGRNPNETSEENTATLLKISRPGIFSLVFQCRESGEMKVLHQATFGLIGAESGHLPGFFILTN